MIPSVHTQTWDTAMASHFHSTSRSQASCSSKRFNVIKLDLYGFIFYHFLVKAVSNGPFTFLLRGKAFGGASSGGGTNCRYVVPWARHADLAELFGSKRSDCFRPFRPFQPFRPVYPLKQNLGNKVPRANAPCFAATTIGNFCFWLARPAMAQMDEAAVLGNQRSHMLDVVTTSSDG